MVFRIICCIVGGYFFGCFSTSYFVGKANNIDIRQYGSGNAGATNSMRTLGKKAGIITLIGDCLKAVIPILLVKYLIFPDLEYKELLALYTGLGAALGHNYPVWLKFKGGKGIAVSTGIFFITEPIGSIFAAILFILIVLFTHYVSLASIFALLFVCIWTMARFDWNLHYCLVIAALYLLALWRHRKNVVRLIHGTENKFNQKQEPLIEGNKNINNENSTIQSNKTL